MAGPGQQIEVTFKRLSLADSNDCVEFYEGASPDKKHLTRRLAEFCGRRSKGVGLPAAFRSETNTVTVDWDSDKSSSDGFEMAWKFVEKEGAAYSVCGGEPIVAAAVSSTGVLRDRVTVSSRSTSLFGARCVRAIKGPKGSVMSIKFNTFGLKTSSYDRFTVYRGEATDKASLSDANELVSWSPSDSGYTSSMPRAGKVEVLPTNAAVIVWSSSTSFSTTATYRQPGFEIEYFFTCTTGNVLSLTAKYNPLRNLTP